MVRDEDAAGALAELSAAVPEYVASQAATAAATAHAPLLEAVPALGFDKCCHPS